jgi:hypothetical protein
LRGAEYKELIGKVESAIQANGSANVVMVMQELEFPEWDAIKADAHFGLKDYRHSTRRVRRRLKVGGMVCQTDRAFTRAEALVSAEQQRSGAVGV